MFITTSLFRLDAVALVMLSLVAFVGWVIVMYSRNYLAGEPQVRLVRYRRALGGTLACVACVIVSNNLLLTAVAWVATSLGLHVLLTHYGDRWQARLAAHKKFIASRIAEAALFTGTSLLAASLGTLRLDLMAERAARHGLDAQGQLGMLLIAVAALVKCAQLPLHGWLVQVMEAPTPVSALLHAGIINLSGFVLVRLAEPLAAAPAAQWLLALVACLSAAVAAMVAMTRVSVKVALAWSTCAQMGFMLVECALGLPELALVHLVGHSLYKAHAFLAAGDVVAGTRLRAFLPPPGNVSLLRSAMAGSTLLALVAAAAIATHATPGLATMLGIAALAIASWLASSPGTMAVRTAGACAGLLACLAALHYGFSAIVPGPARGASVALAATVFAIFLGLYGVQALLRWRPQGPLARKLHPWCFGGFFLDEHFTRLTFTLWPLRHGSS